MSLVIGEMTHERVGRWAAEAENAGLEQRARESLARTAELIEWEGDLPPERLPTVTVALEQVGAASTAVIGEIGKATATGNAENVGLAALGELLVELQLVRDELRKSESDLRLQAMADVQAGLGRLRGIQSSSDLLDKVTEEVCNACGFDRSILFRIDNGKLVAESVHYQGDPEGAAQLLKVGRENPADLDHMLLETEMIRRRKAMLVLDVQSEPRAYKAIADASGSFSYVAAPIMPEGRVIGFIHCDCNFAQRHMDEFDRDMLWAFCEGFGYAYERTVLMERLLSQRDRVRQLLASTDAVMNEVCESELEVARLGEEDSKGVARAAQLLTARHGSRLDELLTRREIEVVQLMARGETNAGIASRLVISQGTVKSHVKHVLRKLRAANRAEAVSRYLRLTGEGLNGHG